MQIDCANPSDSQYPIFFMLQFVWGLPGLSLGFFVCCSPHVGHPGWPKAGGGSVGSDPRWGPFPPFSAGFALLTGFWARDAQGTSQGIIGDSGMECFRLGLPCRSPPRFTPKARHCGWVGLLAPSLVKRPRPPKISKRQAAAVDHTAPLGIRSL